MSQPMDLIPRFYGRRYNRWMPPLQLWLYRHRARRPVRSPPAQLHSRVRIVGSVARQASTRGIRIVLSRFRSVPGVYASPSPTSLCVRFLAQGVAAGATRVPRTVSKQARACVPVSLFLAASTAQTASQAERSVTDVRMAAMPPFSRPKRRPRPHPSFCKTTFFF